MCVCVCACVRACVRACVCVCVSACVWGGGEGRGGGGECVGVLNLVTACKAAYQLDQWIVHFSSVQFKVVSMYSERPVCVSTRLSEVSSMLSLKQFQCSSN